MRQLIDRLRYLRRAHLTIALQTTLIAVQSWREILATCRLSDSLGALQTALVASQMDVIFWRLVYDPAVDFGRV
jgi:hypothetical protein